eukprot:1159415-Rhodomonas_salina.2
MLWSFPILCDVLSLSTLLRPNRASGRVQALVNSGSNTSAQGSAQALSSAIRAALPPDCVAKVLGELEPPKQSVVSVICVRKRDGELKSLRS